MSDTQGLDWLADDEGNLRPEIAEALEAAARPRSPAPPEVPAEIRTAGRWALRALVIGGAAWLAVAFLEWVILACFVLGLFARLTRWSQAQFGPGRVGAAAERRAQAAVRGPAEDTPLHGRGPAVPEDSDPVLEMEE